MRLLSKASIYYYYYYNIYSENIIWDEAIMRLLSKASVYNTLVVKGVYILLLLLWYVLGNIV